jgi:hypothetical protein
LLNVYKSPKIAFYIVCRFNRNISFLFVGKLYAEAWV